MVFGAVFRYHQWKQQVNWFAIFGIERQGLGQLQEKCLHIFCIADTSVWYGDTVAQRGAAKVLACAQAFEDFSRTEMPVFIGQCLTD